MSEPVPIRPAEDRTLVVPPGHVVRTAYLPVGQIDLAYRDHIPVGSVELAYRRRPARVLA